MNMNANVEQPQPTRLPVIGFASPAEKPAEMSVDEKPVTAAGLCEIGCGFLPPGASHACMLACGLV